MCMLQHISKVQVTLSEDRKIRQRDKERLDIFVGFTLLLLCSVENNRRFVLWFDTHDDSN